MKRRVLSVIAILSAVLVALTAFAVSASAASPPVWSVPANGDEVTRMNTDLVINGAVVSVTSPQGKDLAVFIHSVHGTFKGNSNPNGSTCPAVPADGTFCSYNDPSVFQANWNFRGTPDQVNQALSNFTYRPDLDFPQPANATLIDTVNVSASEQIAVGLTGTGSFQIEVLPDNLTPTFPTFPGAVTGLETDANSNLDLLNKIEVDDPDLYTCDPMLDEHRTMTISVAGGGTLTTTYTSSTLTVTGDGTSMISMEGDVTDFNNAIDAMTYEVVPFVAYTATASVFFDDNGCVGYPGPLDVSGTFPIHVKPLAATHFGLVTPPVAVTGVPFGFTVNALDQYDNLATTYVGTVHITSSDGAAVLPADTALVAGTGVLSGAVLNTTGNQTLTATDTVDSSLTGTSDPIAVADPQVVDHFDVSAPATATAGAAVSVTVTAKDAANATVTGYLGTVHFTSSDGGATLPANSTLTNGTGSFNVTFTTAGSQSITATDTVVSAVTGTDSVMVDPAAASSLLVTAPANATNGVAITAHVKASDAYGNTATTYAGMVHLTSSDGAATLPADAMLTNGEGDFSVTLNTDGNQTVTATDTVDSSLTDTSGTIVVSSTPVADHFDVTIPATVAAGVPFNATITAKSASNVTVTGYAGTVVFATNDLGVVPPASTTLVNGTTTIQAVFKTVGNRTLSATDSVDSSITGSDTAAVTPAAANHYEVSAPGTVTAGNAFNITVTARDAYDNIDTNYNGTATFSGTGAGTLPADTMVANGQVTVQVTRETAGTQSITATDTVSSSITGTSTPIQVDPRPADHFGVVAPPSATTGVAFSATVTALDIFDNVVTTYAGTVTFESSDPAAVLPANSTLVNGTKSFSVTLNTVGSHSVYARDSVDSSIAGLDMVDVSNVPPGPATHFMVSAPANATAGASFSYTVTALDAADATATGYSGTVHFTSTDATASLQGDATLTNGSGTFFATFGTDGSWTITATDTVTASITGTSGTIVVSPAPPGQAVAFVVDVPANATAGQQVSMTVTAVDAGNATATGYSGTVHFTSTDGQAVLPADATLVNGVGTFDVTFKTSGPQTITATDTVTSSINGGDEADVAAGAPQQMKVSPPSSSDSGTPFQFTVEVLDAYGNRVLDYAGTLHFTSSDPNAVLPPDSTLTNGFGTFSATFVSQGPQSLAVQDTANGELGGESLAVQVGPPSTTTTTTSTTTPSSTSTTSSTVPGGSSTTTTSGGGPTTTTGSSTNGTTTTTTTTGTLPVTGGAITLLAALGALLLGAGVVILGIRRSRA